MQMARAIGGAIQASVVHWNKLASASFFFVYFMRALELGAWRGHADSLTGRAIGSHSSAGPAVYDSLIMSEVV